MLSRSILVVTAIVGLASLISASLYDANANLELERYIEEVKIIHEQLIELGCRDPGLEMVRRKLLSPTTDEVKLRMKKKLYEKLIDMLVECEQLKAKAIFTSTSQRLSTTTTPTPTTQKITTTTTPAPSSTPAPTTTTQKVTTTTANPQPTECQNAINLTESWRQEHNGIKLRPKNGKRNCDTKEMVDMGRPWFRFTGAAGNHMLNRCVIGESCGTGAPLWTDHAMPSQVGIITPITIYGNKAWNLFDGSCRGFTMKASAIRCSLRENDYVYRYDDVDQCAYGFCGMS